MGLANSLTGMAVMRQQRQQIALAQQQVALAQAQIARIRAEAYAEGYRRGHWDGWHERDACAR